VHAGSPSDVLCVAAYFIDLRTLSRVVAALVSENYMTHFEPGTEFTVGAEPADALVSTVREKLFALRLGQLSTRYVSRRPAQEN
jgi:hypothetical protein